MNEVVRRIAAGSGLGFGGASIGNLQVALPEEQAVACALAAARGGLAFLDTAPQYGLGLSERRVGAALRMLGREEARPIISTKVGLVLRPTFEPQFGHRFVDASPFAISFEYSYDAIMRSVEDSLQRLGLNRVDILYIHNINPERHAPELLETLYRSAVTEGYRGLRELRDAGITDAIGIGNNSPDMCCRFVDDIDVDIVMVASGLTLIDQHGLDELVPKCRAKGIALVAAAPFCSGVLVSDEPQASTYHNDSAPPQIVEQVQRIRSLCADHGIPVPAAALQYPLRQIGAVAVATGFRDAAEIEQAKRWVDQPIPDEVWQDMYSAAAVRDPRGR